MPALSVRSNPVLQMRAFTVLLLCRREDAITGG